VGTDHLHEGQPHDGSRTTAAHDGSEESAMSAMGDRLLLLEDTADALDAIDPDLGNQFRLVNGLPDGYSAAVSRAGPLPPDPIGPAPAAHVASVEDGPDGVRVACSCGRWQADVGWDEIDDLVVAARAHFATEDGAVLDAEGYDRGAEPGPGTPRRRRVS
jgi:hypothetical protein